MKDKIFLVGPPNKDKTSVIEMELRNLGYVVFLSTNATLKSPCWREFHKIDIRFLLGSDMVATINGYQYHESSKMAVRHAKDFQIPVFSAENLIKKGKQ